MLTPQDHADRLLVLMAELDAIADRLALEDAASAEALLLAHDRHLREYLDPLTTAPPAALLEPYLQRHRDVLSLMIEKRDQASVQMRQLRRSRTASTAYQSAQEL